MDFSYNHDLTVRNREAFIYKGRIAENSVRSEILESWQRSKAAKIDPRMAALPLPIPEEVATQAVTEDWIYQRDLAHDNVFDFYKLISSTQSAYFITDDNLTIVIQRGNEALLRQLNAINLCIGCNLYESNIGTNAGSLAKSTGKQSFVIGAEHYIDALQDYFSTAFCNYDDKGNFLCIGLLVCKLDNFTPFQFEILKYYSISAVSQVNLKLRELELGITNELLSLSVDQRNKGLILVDERGIILRTNQWLVNAFALDERSMHRKSLDQVFPELLKVFQQTLATGKPSQLQEIEITSQGSMHKAFFADSLPIYKDDRIVGIAISIEDSRSVHKMINQVTHSSAYFTFADLIGSSSAFTAAKSISEDAAQSISNVLITGESGTGKELFAQSIHNASKRRKGPFVSINCAAIPRELIASELFGYVEGAFTGARKSGAPGKFELADKGTIFLDEIGEMPLEMQSVLLRVLEERMITRVGGSKPIPVDVKVITATNKNLLESIKAKEFRLDLYYRLNVIKIDIPPLRQRPEDIPLLVEHFVAQFNVILHKNIANVTPEVMELLQNYPWPGNVRELRNVIERSMNICRTNELVIENIPKEIMSKNFSSLVSDNAPSEVYKDKILQEFTEKVNEKNKILELMNRYAGNKSRVAKDLGISRTTLYRKLDEMESSLKP
ncbi:sigma 54-interacting transcriptional regulator [Desulfitobacterium sp. THU1]|uniref:sigma-54 interaction domain-containing protein n=1 Tax=Desulfitobacterium sp. THU1 TaxID=3138072 RepID=UPI00311DBB34